MQVKKILFKDFKQFALDLTQSIKTAALRIAEVAGRPFRYLPSCNTRKESLARDLIQQDHLQEGLVGVFGCVEPCRTYFMCGNRQTKKLEFKLQSGKCQHFYFYHLHPECGLMHLRLQSWFPFQVQICINGRHWLSRQMDQHQMDSAQKENCFTWISHLNGAQRLMDKQLEINWPGQLDQISDLKERPEGIRVKHILNANSIKMYDKQGTVLRIETTIDQPRDFRVYREAQIGPHGRAKSDGKKDWRILRKGVADLKRRAEVSRAANDRYLTSLSATSGKVPLFQWVDQVCKPLRRDGRRVRALNRGEFKINGFRNRDLRALLFQSKASPEKQKRRSAAVFRKLALLRGHGLIKKLSGTHRYVLTEKGSTTITALLTARQANINELTKIAA